jgi:hypothetical protein
LWVASDKIVDQPHQHSPIRVGVRHSEDQVGLFQCLQRGQQLGHLPRGRALLKGHRVKGDEQITRAEGEVERGLKCTPLQQLQLDDVVDTQAADLKDALRLLTELDHAPTVFLRRDEVQMRHLGDRMPDRLVEGALGRLSAMQVGDWDPRDHGGGGGSENLVAVAELEH